MRKILVIGGAGFVGSNLCRFLIEQGELVYSLDNYSTGSECNHVDGVKYKKGDAKNINSISMVGNVDIVYHLGEYSRVEQSYSEPFYAASNIIQGIVPVIEYCHRNKAKLIYSGSSTKFGDASSPYSITKASNTITVDGLCSILGIEYAITYFYNVYGPGEIECGKYATVVAKFLMAYNEGEKVVINSGGNQSRNFTHVDDIVRGLLIVGKQGHGDGYGIGSDESFSIKELAEMIGVEYSLGGDVKGNRHSSSLITEKTKSLGWSCRYRLQDYLLERADVS